MNIDGEVSASKKKKHPNREVSHSKPAENVHGAHFASAQPEGEHGKVKKKADPVRIGAGVVLAGCIAVLGVIGYQYFEAEKARSDLEDMYSSMSSLKYKVIPDPDVTSAQTENTSDEAADGDAAVTEAPEVLEPLIEQPFAIELENINPDACGYVRIPDVLDEAVVQYTDNSYYLEHNLYGEKRSCGTIFADYRDVVNDYDSNQSDNIILFGHNQADGTMFGNMDYYRWNYNYWQTNPFIYFSNKYKDYTYVIISSFVTNTEPEHDNGNVFDYWNYINFGGNYSYDDFISEITERSTIITGVDVSEDDKFLTLSTCSTEWEPSRHVIVARRLRDGETEYSIDKTKFSVNPDPKWPAIYYKYNGGSYSGQ